MERIEHIKEEMSRIKYYYCRTFITKLILLLVRTPSRDKKKKIVLGSITYV